MRKKITASELAARRLLPRKAAYMDDRVIIEFVRAPGDRLMRSFIDWDLAASRERLTAPLDAIDIDYELPDPDGFIYHLGRVGSSLAGNILREAPDCLVVAEPKSFGNVLASPGGAADEIRIERFYLLIRLFAATGCVLDRKTIIKFPSWTMLYCDRLGEAFPNTPSCLVYRDPAEILVALTQDPPNWLQRPGMRKFLGQPGEPDYDRNLRMTKGLFGDHLDYYDDGPFPIFVGCFLAKLLNSAVQSGNRFLLLDRRDLAARVATDLACHFGIDVCDQVRERMQRIVKLDAKSRRHDRVFSDDSARKQVEATPIIREISRNMLQPVLNQLIGAAQQRHAGRR